MQQYGADYKKINPNSKVPAIDDNGFILFESHTIMRYLHETRDCDDHWYPSDDKERSKVEEYLNWHLSNIRLGAGGFFARTYLAKNAGLIVPKAVID